MTTPWICFWIGMVLFVIWLFAEVRAAMELAEVEDEHEGE